MLVVDKENDRVLLSRQSRFVPRMWSCLAGFIEVCLRFLQSCKIFCLTFGLAPYSLLHVSQEKAWKRL